MLSYFKNVKKVKQQRVQSIQIMKDFVEGRMDVNNFFEHCKNNQTILELLNQDEKILPLDYDKMDISKFIDRIIIYFKVKDFFNKNKIKVNSFNIEEERYNFIFDIISEWFYSDNINYINDIVNIAPSGLSKEETKTWCRSQLAKLFKYDNYPPEWLTSFNWPIVNGTPLVFKEMIEAIDHNLITNEYIFYDELTKEETRIIQSDYM